MSHIRPYAIVALAYACAASPVVAQSPEQDAMLYIEAVAMPMKADVCAKRITGYPEKFGPNFAQWKKINATRLSSGEAFLRADAQKNNMPFQLNVQSVAIISAQALEKTSQPLLEENCNFMLQQLKVGNQNGG